jgi:hypothetical protein
MALPIAESLNKLAELIASAPEKVKPIVDAAKAGVDLAKDVLDNSPLAKAEREAREQAAKEGRKATVGEIGARAWDNIKESWTPSQAQAAPDYAGSDWRREKDIRRKIYEEPRGPSSSARITAPTFASRSFGAGGAPSAPALGFGGGIAASAGMPSFLRMQPYKPTLDISGLKAEAAQGEQLGDAMREKLSFTAIPTVDTSTFEKAKEGAEEVRTGLEGLNMTVSPSVDASSIDAAHAKLRAFLSDLAKAGAEARALHSHAAASTHSLDGLLGRTSRGAFQAGGGRGVD